MALRAGLEAISFGFPNLCRAYTSKLTLEDSTHESTETLRPMRGRGISGSGERRLAWQPSCRRQLGGMLFGHPQRNGFMSTTLDAPDTWTTLQLAPGWNVVS